MYFNLVGHGLLQSPGIYVLCGRLSLHISGPPNFIESRQRLEGWRTTLERADVEAPEPLAGDWSPQAGYELGRRLSADPDVTAVFVANDQMALGLLRAIHEELERRDSWQGKRWQNEE